MTQDSAGTPLLRTPLYDLHRERGGKMVPFAGYEMPVQYDAGILKEHLHTRESAGLFDIGHMGQAFMGGEDPAAAIERLVPADIKALRDARLRYALLMNEAGGIDDDIMVGRLAGESALYVVVNAATKEADYVRMADAAAGIGILEPLRDRTLLALQGPKAEAVLVRHAPAAATLSFMDVARMNIAGSAAIVSRSGYTGGDGFEISLPAADAERVARLLLAEAEVLPIGLGARDSLRLEAGLPLYGHDIDETTSPVEAALTFSLGKRRLAAGDFPGADRVRGELANGTNRIRVGMCPLDKAPAREGTEIAAEKGRIIGRVTSGGYGPSAGGPIAMGYVEPTYRGPGARVDLIVRGIPREARVTTLPFVPHSYKRAKL